MATCSKREVPAVQILDGRGNTRIRWEQDLHGGGRYLVELRGLGRTPVAEVRVSTASRSDLLSKLQAEMGAQVCIGFITLMAMLTCCKGNNQLRRFRRRNGRSYCGCKI